MEKEENKLDFKHSHSRSVVLGEHVITSFFKKYVIRGPLAWKEWLIGHENLLYMLLYNQITMNPNEYDEMIGKHLDARDPNTANNINIFKEYNYIFMTKDVDLLEKSKLWNKIVKIFNPKGKKEPIELIAQIQETGKPLYLTLIKQMDRGDRYYDFLKKK